MQLNQKGKAIGVLDSGVGGLSVLSQIRKYLPEEHLLYVADSAHMPYGCKTAEEVKQRCLLVAGFLLNQGIKALVVACNTATSVAVQTLRTELDIPVIGMEPAVKPAVKPAVHGSKVAESNTDCFSRIPNCAVTPCLYRAECQA
jgi:glutamate racemase